MTRREVIRNLEGLKIASRAHAAVSDNPAYKKAEEALNIALADLRGHTREQVKKVWGGYRGACGVCLGDHPVGYGSTKKHGGFAVDLNGQSLHILGNRINVNFCPMCGRPLTDEAVDIVMQRLEALKDGTI